MIYDLGFFLVKLIFFVDFFVDFFLVFVFFLKRPPTFPLLIGGAFVSDGVSDGVADGVAGFKRE